MTDTKPTTLYTALLAFQRAVGPVKKDASNPAFRTKYATLQSVLETVEDPLSDNGLVLLQRFTVDEGEPILVTEVIHAETGERITSAVRVVGKDMADPQKVGGAITYYRRYSLLALLGLAPEDDDGNAGAKPPPPRQEPHTRTSVTSGSMLPVPQPPRPAPGQPAASGEARRVLTEDELIARELAYDGPPDPRKKPAASGTQPATWTTIWQEAKARGIPDRKALDAYLAPEKVDESALWKTMARIKEKPPLPAGHSG